MPRISVIIPVYNTGPYIRRCLDSVVNQTLSDIEIICIDDCSVDNSPEILSEYSQIDNRIKFISFKENKNASCARNTGIEIARGEYLGFVDSDDFIDFDFYKKLYEKATSTSADITKSNLKSVGENDYQISHIEILDEVRRSKFLFQYVPTAIFKRSFLLQNNILFPTELSYAEDGVFETMVSLACNKIEFEERVSYYYVWRSESLSRQRVVDVSKIKDIEASILTCIKLLNASNIDKEDYMDAVEARYYRLSNFCENKILTAACKLYVTEANRRLLEGVKYQQELQQRIRQSRVEKVWYRQREKILTTNVLNV